MNEIDELFEAPQDNEERLSAIGQAIAQKRDEAVDGRRNSGIEEVWEACEEAYLGIDDANRAEFTGAKWAKPASAQGPVEKDDKPRTNEVRSTLYVRLTSRYVDAGAAKLGEIILPIDDKAFAFDATPVPDLVEKLDDETPANFSDGTPMLRDAEEGEEADANGKVQIKVKEFAQEAVTDAEKAAKKAETRIHDWQIESQYQPEMRKVLFDMARIGAGVLKAPFPTKQKAMASTKADQGVALQIIEKVVPGSKWVDPWNFFPDPSCGENVHDGDYCLERDFLSARQLKALKKLPGYLARQIDRVIVEGPGKRNLETGPHRDVPKDNRFEVFYFYGELKRDELLLVNPGCKCPETETVYVIATLVNDTVIRAVLNPLDSGRFPYNCAPWQRRPGSCWGVGVAEQVSVPQRIVTAATRAMLNNAGWSAGVQIVIDRAGIFPADGSYTITPNKIWYKGAETTADEVAKAFAVFQIPNAQTSLQAVIDYGFRLAEECSSIPLVTQGQSGKTTPDTLGGMQLQNNNANQLLRNVGYNVDDFITEPAVRAYYEWLLLDPEVPDDEKGDFQINAHGSSAMIERAIQDQTLLQLGQMVMNPIFGMSPPKWFGEMLKSKKLNPKDFEMDEAEKRAQAQQQPAPAPAVQAAQIREQGATQRHQMDVQLKKDLAAQDTDRDTAFVEAQNVRTRLENEERQKDREFDWQMAILKYANDRQISLDQAKTDLAKVTMQLNTQKELSGVRGPQVATPLTEPPGRAPTGEAYAK